jgi:hypothetical protein
MILPPLVFPGKTNTGFLFFTSEMTFSLLLEPKQMFFKLTRLHDTRHNGTKHNDKEHNLGQKLVFSLFILLKLNVPVRRPIFHVKFIFCVNLN